MDHLNPDLERLYIDEVRYLHALWRKGPPREPNPNPSLTLRPLNSTNFKRKARHVSSGRRKAIVSDAQWLLPSESPPKTTWGEEKTVTATQTWPASEEEQARFAAIQLQKKGFKSCQDFFSSHYDEEEEEEQEDAMDVEAGSRETEAFEFLLGLFTEDEKLRTYYEKNGEKGQFCCLICGVITGNLGKIFGDCVALVQHSISVSKTKRRFAHRAFGRAVCRVLGWDINRLPSIVLDAGEPLGRVLANSSAQVSSKEDGSTD